MNSFSFVFLYRRTDFACFTPLASRLKKTHLMSLCAFIAGYRLNFNYIQPCDSTWTQPSMHKRPTSYTCYSCVGGHDQARGSEPGELPHLPGLYGAKLQYGDLPHVGAQVPHHQNPSRTYRKGTGWWNNYVFVSPYLFFFCLSPWFSPQFVCIILHTLFYILSFFFLDVFLFICLFIYLWCIYQPL